MTAVATILGLNAYHGDASAVLLSPRGLEGAMEEERFTRRKHEAGFPQHAVRACLEVAGLAPADLDAVAISRQPRAHLWRKLAFAITGRPRWRLIRDRLRNEAKILSTRRALAEAVQAGPAALRARVHRVEHHHAHLASTFFAAPFDQAAVFSIDGFGDFISTMWGVGRGTTLTIDGCVGFPHSMGILYSAISQYLGFPHYGDEFKVMGLASTGAPTYFDALRRVVRDGPRGGFRLNPQYFRHHHGGVAMTWTSGSPRVDDLFQPALERLLGPRRRPGAPIEPRHADIAASVQAVLEHVVLAMLRRLAERTGQRHLCLAGGVALNCTLNGRILRETAFERLYIQPAAHDAGTALGAALYVRHHVNGRPRDFVMDHVAWGLAHDREACRRAIDAHGLACRDLSPEALAGESARLLADGAILGWFQGRFEWGPRALGHRSLLADPRRAGMKGVLNSRIKHRESFRPFAPSVLREAASDYFDLDDEAPFMLATSTVRPSARTVIPAVTHVDNTARVQTVRRDVNPDFWRLIDAFGRLTGVPVLLNTSFNENEPIVNTPDEAIRCFLRNDVDALALGPFLVQRGDTPQMHARLEPRA